MTTKRLEIDDFDEGCLAATAYYFRLHKHVALMGQRHDESFDIDKRGGTLELAPGVLYKVMSLERFSLPLNVMGLLGNQSGLPVEYGVELLNGIAIDPGYRGHLSLVVVNRTDTIVSLKYGARLGKLLLFDVSDTGLEDAKIAKAVQIRSQEMDKLDDRSS